MKRVAGIVGVALVLALGAGARAQDARPDYSHLTLGLGDAYASVDFGASEIRVIRLFGQVGPWTARLMAHEVRALERIIDRAELDRLPAPAPDEVRHGVPPFLFRLERTGGLRTVQNLSTSREFLERHRARLGPVIDELERLARRAGHSHAYSTVRNIRYGLPERWAYLERVRGLGDRIADAIRVDHQQETATIHGERTPFERPYTVQLTAAELAALDAAFAHLARGGPLPTWLPAPSPAERLERGPWSDPRGAVFGQLRVVVPFTAEETVVAATPDYFRRHADRLGPLDRALGAILTRARRERPALGHGFSLTFGVEGPAAAEVLTIDASGQAHLEWGRYPGRTPTSQRPSLASHRSAPLTPAERQALEAALRRADPATLPTPPSAEDFLTGGWDDSHRAAQAGTTVIDLELMTRERAGAGYVRSRAALAYWEREAGRLGALRQVLGQIASRLRAEGHQPGPGPRHRSAVATCDGGGAWHGYFPTGLPVIYTPSGPPAAPSAAAGLSGLVGR